MKRHALQHIPFFVYGTLIPGQPNDHLWRDGINSVETAVFNNGRLYDMGHYPMLVEEGRGTVRGKLISVTDRLYLETVNRLDSLEGYLPDQPARSSYLRVKREVTTSSGQKINSWLYVGRQKHALKPQVIPGGDWVAYAAHMRTELDNWWETVDSVFGLHLDEEDAAA